MFAWFLTQTGQMSVPRDSNESQPRLYMRRREPLDLIELATLSADADAEPTGMCYCR